MLYFTSQLIYYISLPHSILAIFFRNAQKKDIIKAYRKLAREWHPDNFQDESEKEVAEKRFIEIAAAKEVLTDPGMSLKLYKNACNKL